MEKVTSIYIDMNEDVGSVDISFKLEGSGEIWCSEEFREGTGTRKTLEVIETKIRKLIKDRIMRQALWQEE